MSGSIGVGVVGCGLIGRRRAAVAHASARSRLVAVTDVNAAVAAEVAGQCDAVADPDWKTLIARPEIGIVVIATPNAYLTEIGCAALAAGKHVLMEKPMGRNFEEARRLVDAEAASGHKLKIGFNHRFHPAIAEAHDRFVAGEIGKLISVRCRYGHGGRPGYEREWRGSKELAGGGTLTDQGVHVLDLMQWFAGTPQSVYAALQRAVWPIGELEDNAFATLHWSDGVVGTFQTSWIQWKNTFVFEVYGDKGSLTVDGLGRSYGVETLQRHLRRPEGGAPDIKSWTYDIEDNSWQLEWDNFLDAVLDDRPMLGTGIEGLAVMGSLDALYRSAAGNTPVTVPAIAPVRAAGATARTSGAPARAKAGTSDDQGLVPPAAVATGVPWDSVLPRWAGGIRWHFWQAMKRAIDLIGASLMLFLLLPLFALIALLIKVDSRGPVLHPMNWRGYRGRRFLGYKFRTMVSDAEVLKRQLMEFNEMSGPVFKMRQDPRVTRVGKHLRRWSLDELPQLLSVLRGDMSLVGPRPPMDSEYAQYSAGDALKLAVIPGITCLWQVSGRSAISSFEEWLRLDLEYIRNWNFWLDLRILLRTIPAVLLGRGAQ